MWLDESTNHKREFFLEKPYINAAGFLGFFPDPKLDHLWEYLGAFVTNPISINSRKPAGNRTCLQFSGGFLLHTAFPNPGFNSAMKRYRAKWERSPLPIIVHLLVEDADSLSTMVRQLEPCDNVIAVELGFDQNTEITDFQACVKAADGELPLITRLTNQQANKFASSLQNMPVSMVRVGESYGALPLPNGDLVQGRLFGPALLPQSLVLVKTLSEFGTRFIGGGGIYTKEDVSAMFTAGAAVVALDAILWQGCPKLSEILD